jgi:MFS family permease
LLDIGLFAVGSLVVAISPNFWVLLLGRSAQGLGAGGIFPVASAVIGDTFPENKRGRALGLIGAVFGIAFLIGPILGGILLLLSWHWLFLVNLPLALLVIWMGWRILPHTQTNERQPFDLKGMLVLVALLTGFTFGISQLDTKDFLKSLESVAVWLPLLVAVAGLVLFTWLEHRAIDPIIRPSLLGTRQLILGNLMAAGAGLGEAALVFLPALAVAAFNMKESTASFLILPLVLVMAVASPMAGRLLDKIGSKLVLLLGTSFLTAGMFLLGFWGDIFWLYMLAGIIVAGGLGSMLGAPIRYLMLAEAPLSDRAAAQGMITISAGIGQMLAAALVGAAATSFGGGANGYTTAFIFVAFVSLLLVILCFGLKDRQQESANSSEKTETPDQMAAVR